MNKKNIELFIRNIKKKMEKIKQEIPTHINTDLPTEYLCVLYLLILRTELYETSPIHLSLIPKHTEYYMGYVLTWVLWQYSYTIDNHILEYKSVNRIRSFYNIQQNTFISDEEMSYLYIINARIHKIWRAFRCILRLWRWKRAKIYNTEDFYMNPICSGQKNSITLLKNNQLYVFSLKDLIGNFNRELSNTCNLFVEPLSCKNPYTNECFTKSDLYNIYFAIKKSTFIMPKLLHDYFLSDFCLSKYMNENEYSIREYYIDNYINNVTHDILLESVNIMLKNHKIKNIRIHKDFPKLKLKELMMPYLKLHFISIMSINKWRKADTFMRLHKLLHYLQYQYPEFGRKKYAKVDKHRKSIFENQEKKEDKVLKIYKSYFEMKMPKIKSVCLNQFMQNHKELNTTFDSYMMFDYQMIQQQNREEILNREMTPRSSSFSTQILFHQEEGEEEDEEDEEEGE